MDFDAPRIVGDFKLKHEIGRGGMGVVYLARQISLGRDVALKVLPSDQSFDDDRVLRFQREAALLGRLSHPNIVKIYTVGEEGPCHYLAMEYVEGTDLERVLHARITGVASAGANSNAGRFGEDFRRASVESIRDVARALARAHEAGIVHRDVKPSNILIEKTGRCVLADFGLARDVSVAALTRSNAAIGTPYYMSPERFGTAEPTPAADVYSAGAVLYQCLTGVKPFDADSPEELMRRILHEEAAPPRKLDPTIPRDLQTIVMTCLEKVPASRYRDGSSLAADLERFLIGDPIAASPASVLTRAFRRARRRRTSMLGLVAAILVAAAFLVWGFFEKQSKEITSAVKGIHQKLDKDERAAAIVDLDRLLAKHPGLIDMRFERAETLLKEKRWIDAATDYEWLVLHGDEYSRAADFGLSLARALAAHGEGLDSIDVSGEPGNGREAFYRGMIHQARRDLVSAEREHAKATTLPPAPVEALYSLGAVRFKLKDYDGAELAFLDYQRVRNRADVDLYLGKIEDARTNYDAARAHFARYVQKLPNSVVAWNNLAAAHLALANAYDQNKWTEQAEQYRAQAREAVARAKAIEPDFYLLAFNEAVLAIQEGHVTAAEERFASAIRGCAKDADQRREMTWKFARQLDWSKENEKAVACMEQAASGSPDFLNDYYFVFSYADILANAERYTDALAIIDDALAGPLRDNVALIAQRATIALKQG